MTTITHTRLASLRACPRQHWMRYDLGLRRTEEPEYLSFGRAWHAAVLSGPSAFDHLHPAAATMGRALLASYPPVSLIAAEVPFAFPVGSDSWEGVLDGIAEQDGRLLLVERKTSSEDIAPSADYWNRLQIDQQISGYMIAARRLGYPVEGILYDVVRKPALRLLLATPAEKQKRTKAGTLYANQREADETIPEFYARLDTAIRESPATYYQRIVLGRMDADLAAFTQEQAWQVEHLHRVHDTGHHFRNTGACGFCAYLPICHLNTLAESTPVGYVRTEDFHPELPVRG